MAARPRAESRAYSCTARTDSLNRSNSRRTMLATRASERDDSIKEARSALSCRSIIPARRARDGSAREVFPQGLSRLRRQMGLGPVMRMIHDHADVRGGV